MTTIGIDAKTLEVAAAASAHAFEQAIVHIGEEIKARNPEKLEPLVATLAAEGPYAYTILPEVRDGSVRLPVLTTRDEIRDAYAFIRGLSDLHEVIGLTEIRGSWYLFQDNMTHGSLKGSEDINTNQTVSLFPSGAGTGITGELVWRRVPRSSLGDPDESDIAPDDALLARYQVHQQFERFLEGLRSNDVESVLGTIHAGAASAVRDYVADSGTLIELGGEQAHREWFTAFFDKFEITEIQRMCQVVEDWYVFAELRFTVIARDGSRTSTFNTAEFHIPAKSGRFIARVGHGTDPSDG